MPRKKTVPIPEEQELTEQTGVPTDASGMEAEAALESGPAEFPSDDDPFSSGDASTSKPRAEMSPQRMSPPITGTFPRTMRLLKVRRRRLTLSTTPCSTSGARRMPFRVMRVRSGMTR